MKPITSAFTTAVLAGLCACAPRSDPAASSATDPTPASATPIETTAAPAAPAPASASSGPDGDRDLASWDGYDAMKLGMSEVEVRKVWGADLKGDAPMDGSTCFHLSPTWVNVPAEFALMFENDRFVRYSVESPDLLAPGGGKVGMDRARISALYGDRIKEQPHKYTEGNYLRITEGGSVLIFETDGAGLVTAWRVGVPPQVDYVEGCS